MIYCISCSLSFLCDRQCAAPPVKALPVRPTTARSADNGEGCCQYSASSNCIGIKPRYSGKSGLPDVLCPTSEPELRYTYRCHRRNANACDNDGQRQWEGNAKKYLLWFHAHGAAHFNEQGIDAMLRLLLCYGSKRAGYRQPGE